MTFTTKDDAYTYVVSTINAYNDESGWGDANVQPDDTMLTLGFDSLDVLDIETRIERDLSIDDLDLDLNDTASEIADKIWLSLNPSAQ